MKMRKTKTADAMSHISPVRLGMRDHRLSQEQIDYFRNNGAKVADTVRVLG